jgi:hypothetical protein
MATQGWLAELPCSDLFVVDGILHATGTTQTNKIDCVLKAYGGSLSQVVKTSHFGAARLQEVSQPSVRSL